MSNFRSGGIPKGISLANTVHSEVAPCLPLPSLPVFCGALDQDLRLIDDPVGSVKHLNRSDVADQATKISKLLLATDVSYLNLKMEVNQSSYGHEEHLDLYTEVLRCNSEVFEYIPPGPANEQMCNNMVPNNKVSERKLVVQNLSSNNEALKDKGETQRPHQHDVVIFSSRKPKSKKKANDDTLLSTEPDGTERQDAAVESFCEVLEDLCGRAEISMDDREEGEAEWLLLPVVKIRNLVKEVMSIRASKFLHLVPVVLLERMLKVLDHQIHSAEGLSINQSENSNSDVVSAIAVALESIHAAIAIMAYDGMPKQIYKEEIIERIVEFSRRQTGDVMSACDPAFRPTNNPTDNGSFHDEDDDDYDEEFGSAIKKRRTAKATKVKRSGANKTSAAAHNIFQKLCTIIGFLKDLLMIERLSDSCILQLVKICFSTLLVDNIQLLQLKAISVLGGIFYSYAQHRVYVMDELLHLLLKLPFSKRIPRTYHLADDEQRQIQMITALLIQLINCSGNLPASLREASDSNPLFNIGIDSSYLHKSQEAVTEACCLFWSRVLQRFANTKTQNQEASEFKIMLENLVMDLISTLNLPEYPASAHILEVLCVLLLQNAGLKSKDIAARSIAIDILGTVAAKLKCEAVLCKKEKFWIVQELVGGDDTDDCPPNDACSVCLDSRIEKPLVTCEGCQRLFHVDCLGISEHEVSGSSWLCQLCLCKKQLFFLQSYCKSQGGGEGTHTRKKSKSSDSADITKTEIVQQMLLNYLQDSGSAEDVHIFTRWFYICLWYKEDPTSQEKFLYYLARLKSKSVVRGSGMVSSPLLTRSSIKKITLALAQNSSFPRGFDKILYLLLASLREGSPVIRAKALRAVSIIVEADPEVLGDKYVQTAVEGRFCDSAISVREAALELVGRYIASHPNVALRYYGKVAERVKDTGVSVRKRAIKIIKDMCASNANFPEFNSACIEILSRISDEESSIQDLVCKTFYEFWFEESSGSQNQIFAEGSSITLEIAKKTEQMVEMLRKMPNNQFLVIVIKRNLALDFLPQSAKAAGISHVMLASVRKRCELMCKCLLEKILRVEENINEVDAGALHYVLLLHAFCLVNPALCAPASNPSQFVVTLQPYLKKQANNRAVAQLVECIVFVIDSVLPLVRKLPQSVVEELEQDLKQMIVRHSFFTVVHACIKCLCSMSKVSGTGSSVVGYLIQVFLKRLDFLGFNNIQQVCRSLFCLGLLIRYGSSLLGMSLSSKQNLAVVGSLSLFKKYFHAEDFALKIRSLQALGYVLIARPEFMLEKDIENILETTLSSSTDDRLKMQSLQNLYEYLQDAEHQMENDKAENDTVTYNTVAGTAVPVAAGAGDTNICGGIIQLYWNSILGRCLDADEDVRQSTLKIVEIVLRQGLVHPITCVPYLIALETDPQEANSKLAHHLLMNMNEKYPAFFESRLGDGLQMSFIFMQAMSQSSSENSNSKVHTKSPNNAKGKSEGTSFSYARLGVSRIYKVIRGNRVSRNKFMSSIVRKFDTPGWHNSVVLFLIYCTEILSLLPFALPEEPLYLIYAINRVLQVRSGAVESNMKAFLHKLQEQNRKEPANGIVQHEPFAQPVPKENSFVDDNRQVDQEFPNEISFTHAVPVEPDQHSMIQDKPIIISADDLPNIQANCLAACALQLLLKLKRHLKIVYGLDDARCQAFSPTDPAKPGEFLTRQNIPFVVGETNITRPTTYEDVLQRYQEFKNALREDTVDYSVYTANIKRKRPPGRKSMKAVPVPGRMNCGNNGDDDDDDDDENWGNGAHITSGGRRGGGMSTRSRQRL